VTKLLVGSTKKIFNLEVIVEDRNKEYNDGPYLFCILNQNSLLEMIIYYAAAPIRVKLIQNIEFTVIPFFGWISALLGSVTIIRQITFQARRGMAKVASTMRENNDSFVVSVEGRRSLDGNLSPFKKGPAIVAIESKARIIPVTLKNARDILPFGEWRINSGTVTVTLHEPIDTWSLTFADRDAVTNRMREIAEKELIKHNS
jgi:1-acyl-sn-glycerol-3-phosphate acyltransferase